MVTLFVRHKVADYAAWRKVYDEFHRSPATKDVLAQSVHVAVDDPLDVTVTHDFETLAVAQAFLGSEILKSTMGRAGVAGPPTIWITRKS
ncbi:cyclase [Alsobacter sp. R-9]